MMQSCILPNAFCGAEIVFIKQARLFLSRATQEDRKKFLQLLAKPNKSSKEIKGPASALRECLLTIAWNFSPEGDVQLNRYKIGNILQSPLSILQRFASQAWQEHLLMFFTEHKKLFHFPAIDKSSVCQVLLRFNEKQRLMILREVAGAFQTKHQQLQWDPTTDPTCEFCGAHEDSREHRMLLPGLQ